MPRHYQYNVKDNIDIVLKSIFKNRGLILQQIKNSVTGTHKRFIKNRLLLFTQYISGVEQDFFLVNNSFCTSSLHTKWQNVDVYGILCLNTLKCCQPAEKAYFARRFEFDISTIMYICLHLLSLTRSIHSEVIQLLKRGTKGIFQSQHKSFIHIPNRKVTAHLIAMETER